MSHTYKQYDGDDGYQTLTHICDVCDLMIALCDCDDNYATSDRSRTYITGHH